MNKIGYKQSINQQLILYIFLFSSLITVLITAFQLYLEYVEGVEKVKSQIYQMEILSLPALTNNLWNLYEKQLKTQLDDLLQLPSIKYLEIRSRGKIVVSSGSLESKKNVSVVFQMVYIRENEKIPIGKFIVVATLEEVYQNLYDRILIILISNALKTLFVSTFIFFIFQFLVTRHLLNISQHIQHLTPDHLDTKLTLKRRAKQDELQQVVTTINEMGANLSKTTVSREEIKASLKEKEILLKEIHHRVKNNLQFICSLLDIQSMQVEGQQSFDVLQKNIKRIRSMALVHEQLYLSETFAKIEFCKYIEDLADNLLCSYTDNSDNVTIKTTISEVYLDIDKAISCALIINELVSNSLKYAFLEDKEGEICIEFYAEKDNKFTLIVSDNGVGFSKDFDFNNTKTFGLKLVNIFTDQLNGAIELSRKGGAKCIIVFYGD